MAGRIIYGLLQLKKNVTTIFLLLDQTMLVDVLDNFVDLTAYYMLASVRSATGNGLTISKHKLLLTVTRFG